MTKYAIGRKGCWTIGERFRWTSKVGNPVHTHPWDFVCEVISKDQFEIVVSEFEYFDPSIKIGTKFNLFNGYDAKYVLPLSNQNNPNT